MTKDFSLTSRYVDDRGETLIVGKIGGVKVLVDPCDESIVVFVPCGRQATLVRYSFSGLVGGRDAHVIAIFNRLAGFGFASVVHPKYRVSLQDLPEGKQVDVLPASDPAAAYAAIPRPMPVFFGAVAVQPQYAFSAAEAVAV